MILRLLGDHSKIAVVIIGTKRGRSDEIQKSRIHQCEFGKKEGGEIYDCVSTPHIRQKKSHIRRTRQPSSVSFPRQPHTFCQTTFNPKLNQTTFSGYFQKLFGKKDQIRKRFIALLHPPLADIMQFFFLFGFSPKKTEKN